MRLLYFNIWNGEVGKPSILPAYRVTTHHMKIIKIETCFNIGNILERGKEWYLNQVDQEWEVWENTHPHLLPSLKKFVKKEYFKHPFQKTNFIESNPRFPYVVVWRNTKQFNL